MDADYYMIVTNNESFVFNFNDYEDVYSVIVFDMTRQPERLKNSQLI